MTAWSPSSARRSRSTVVLWRAVGLGLFLFGLVFTHVASPEATSRHLGTDRGVVTASVMSPATVSRDVPAFAGAPDGPRHEHPQQHTVEECALGQPPQGPGVELPCLSPLDPRWQDGVSASVRAQRGAGRDVVLPIAHAADSTILRT